MLISICINSLVSGKRAVYTLFFLTIPVHAIISHNSSGFSARACQSYIFHNLFPMYGFCENLTLLLDELDFQFNLIYGLIVK